MPEGVAAERRDIRLLYLLAGLVTISQGALELTLPLDLHGLHYPLPLVGGAVAGMALGQILSRIPGGAVYGVDRARRLIVSALVVFSLTTGALSLTGAWPVIAALVTVHGFAMGLTTTFMLAILIDVRPAGSRVASTMAWYTAAISTGYAIGNPLAAEVITLRGHGAAFVVSAAAGLVAAAAAAGLRLRAAPASRAEPASPGTRFGAGALAAVLALPAGIWLASLAVFYINFISDLLGTYFPIFAVSAGIPVAFVGLLKSANSLSATGIRFAAAALFRLLPVGPVNQAAIVSMAVGVVALSFLPGRGWLLAIFALIGVSRGLVRVTTATAIAEERPRSGASSGMASGVYNAGLDAGSMLAPPLGGLVAAQQGIPNTFRLAAIVLPVLYYGVWLLIRRRPAPAQAVPATSAE